MKVIVLGYGGWISIPSYGHTSILILDTDGRNYLLLDPGEGVYRSMYECGYGDVEKLKAVIVTHSHGDHVLGLPTLVQYAKTRGARFKVIGLQQTLDSATELLRATSVSNYGAHLELVPVEAGSSIKLGDFTLRFAEASHTVPSMVVRIEEGSTGKCLVYTGDTSFSNSVVELARGCELLIHESSFEDSQRQLAESLGHSTISDCVKVAVGAGNRAVMPIHFSLSQPYINPVSIPKGLTVVYPSRCLEIVV